MSFGDIVFGAEDAVVARWTRHGWSFGTVKTGRFGELHHEPSEWRMDKVGTRWERKGGWWEGSRSPPIFIKTRLFSFHGKKVTCFQSLLPSETQKCITGTQSRVKNQVASQLEKSPH